MPKITVDGKTIEAKDRQMILQACLDTIRQQIGLKYPTE